MATRWALLDVGPQRRFYLPECWLNFGDGKQNVLTMALRPVNQSGTTMIESLDIGH